jgi:hypothetical protein
MRPGFFFVLCVECGPSQDLGPVVTCSDITYANNGTECGFDEPGVCSDGHAYGVNCQDDSTCTCAQDGHIDSAVIASNATSGFCASITKDSLHDLAAHCGFNLNQ